MYRIFDKKKYSLEPKVIRRVRSTPKTQNSKNCKKVTFKENIFSSFKRNRIISNQNKNILDRNEIQGYFYEKMDNKYSVFDKKVNLKKIKDSFKNNLSLSIIQVNEKLLLSENDDKKENFSKIENQKNVKKENLKNHDLNFGKKEKILKIDNLIKNKGCIIKSNSFKKSFLKFIVKKNGLKKIILDRKKEVIKNSFFLNRKKSLKNNYLTNESNRKVFNKTLAYQSLRKNLSSKKFLKKSDKNNSQRKIYLNKENYQTLTSRNKKIQNDNKFIEDSLKKNYLNFSIKKNIKETLENKEIKSSIEKMKMKELIKKKNKNIKDLIKRKSIQKNYLKNSIEKEYIKNSIKKKYLKISSEKNQTNKSLEKKYIENRKEKKKMNSKEKNKINSKEKNKINLKEKLKSRHKKYINNSFEKKNNSKEKKFINNSKEKKYIRNNYIKTDYSPRENYNKVSVNVDSYLSLKKMKPFIAKKFKKRDISGILAKTRIVLSKSRKYNKVRPFNNFFDGVFEKLNIQK